MPPDPTVQAEQPIKPRGKKGLIIGIIVAVVVAIAIGVVSFVLVRANSSEGMLKSAFSHLVTARQLSMDIHVEPVGTDVEIAGLDLSIAMDADQSAVSIDGRLYLDENLSIGVEAFVYDESTYLRINGLSDLLDGALSDVLEEDLLDFPIDVFMPILEPLDNQWIAISEDDLSPIIGDMDLIEIDDDGTLQCLIDALSGSTDRELSYSEAAKIFADNNPFNIVNRLDRTDGITPFKISANEPGAADYFNALVRAATGVDLNACITDTSDIAETPEMDIVVYIGGGLFSRTIERVVITADDSITTIDFSYDDIPTLTSPDNAKSFGEIIEDIMEAFMQMLFLEFSAFDPDGFEFDFDFDMDFDLDSLDLFHAL